MILHNMIKQCITGKIGLKSGCVSYLLCYELNYQFCYFKRLKAIMNLQIGLFHFYNYRTFFKNISFRFWPCQPWIVIFLIVTFHNLSSSVKLLAEKMIRYVKNCPNFWPYKLFLELHFPSMQWKGLIYNTVAINQFLEVMFPFFYTYNDVELFICYDVIGSKNYVSDQKNDMYVF